MCVDQCIYLRPDAQGDGSGSDWSNALPGLPSQWQRGYVCVLAAGDYGSATLSAPDADTKHDDPL